MSIITEFERKVDVQTHPIGWLRFENRFFFILNNDDKKCKKNSIKRIRCLGIYFSIVIFSIIQC